MANKQMKRCSTVLIIRENQTKTTVRFTPITMTVIKRTQITNVGADEEKREPLNIVGGNVYWYGHCEKQCGDFSKLKIEVPHDPEIPILGIFM